jgi:hypothetical protein
MAGGCEDEEDDGDDDDVSWLEDVGNVVGSAAAAEATAPLLSQGFGGETMFEMNGKKKRERALKLMVAARQLSCPGSHDTRKLELEF